MEFPQCTAVILDTRSHVPRRQLARLGSLGLRWIVLMIGLLVLGVTDPVQAADPVVIAPAAASSWIGSDPMVQILDVRSREEYVTGHLEKSLRVAWPDKDFAAGVRKFIDPSRPVLVYCQSGKRSAKAAGELVKLGFKDVRDLQGGVNQWVKTGNPLVKTKPQARP